MRTLIILLLFGYLANAQDGYLVSYMQGNYDVCTADPNEQNTTANATSDPNCNESTDLLGWTAVNCTLELESVDVSTGSYALKVTADVSNSTSYVYFSTATTVGDTFDLSFDVKQVSGSDDTSRNTLRYTGGTYTSPIPSVWTTFTNSLTSSETGNSLVRVYVDDTTTSSGDGNVVLIDNFSLIKTN